MKIPFLEDEMIRRSSLVFIATFAASIISLFINIVISRLLGPETFGTFKTVMYLFSFLPLIAELGVNVSLVKYIAEFGNDIKKIRYMVRWFLNIKVLSYISIAIIIFLLRDSMALYFLKDASLGYLIVAGIFMIIMGLSQTFNCVVLGMQNFKLYSLSQFLNSCLPALLAALFSGLGVFYMVIGWGLGLLAGNIPNIIFLFKKNIFGVYDKFDVKRLFFRFSLPVYPIELSSAFFTAIVPFLSLFFDQKLIGYYSFAFMFYYAATLIPNSLSSVLFPKISELNGQNKHGEAKGILRKAMLYYSLFVVAGLIFAVFFSEWFITLISNDYLPSLFMFQVIFAFGFVFGYNVIYTNYLKGLGKVKRYALLALFQNLILIAISFVLLSIS